MRPLYPNRYKKPEPETPLIDKDLLKIAGHIGVAKGLLSEEERIASQTPPQPPLTIATPTPVPAKRKRSRGLQKGGKKR
jgi:hypothetical protein